MTIGFGAILFAVILIYSGLENLSVPDVVLGRTPPPHEGVGGTGNPASGTPDPGVDEMPLDPRESANLARRLKQQHPEIHPGIRNVVAQVLTKFPSLTITSTTGGNHVRGSYHYQGRAADIGGDQATMDHAATWIAKHMTPLLTEGIHNPGLSVKNHTPVPHSVYAAVWDGHKNHIHLAV